MKNKRHTTEEIIRILRKADGEQTVEEVCREFNISEQTFYRWRRKYGRMEMADAKRLKELSDENGELKKMLTLIDDCSRQCLALKVDRKLRSQDVLNALAEVMARRGVPKYIRSDNGSEFIAKEVQEWFRELGIRTIYIDQGSPWQNGHVESFHNRLRDECLNREILLSLTEAKVLIEQWRQFYNREHPHSRLGFQSPDEFARNQMTPDLGCAPASPPLHPSLNPTT